MVTDGASRRSLLKAAGSAGVMAGLPEAALAFQPARQATHEVAANPGPPTPPQHTIRFAVIGLDHVHINRIVDAIRRGGGELAAVYSANPRVLADFQKRNGSVKVARSEDEILNDLPFSW